MAHWSQSPQWAEKRRYTLQDMLVLLRIALSEPHAGSWGTVVYDVDKDFATTLTEEQLATTMAPEPSKYAVNELAYMLNLAQIEVVRDLYERGFAFPEVQYRENVFPGMDTVPLQGDFMAIESVFHVCDQEKRLLHRSHLKQLQDTDAYWNSSYSDRYYELYEVRGSMGETVVSGQLDTADVLDVDDRLKLPQSDFDKVTVGDFVMNTTDGSAARVLKKTTNTRTLQLDELVGGRTDTFEALDYYNIQSASQPFECLNLWPRIRVPKEDQVYTGSPDNWKVETWTAPTRLRFYLDTLPSEIHPRKVRVHAFIREDTTPAATSPTISETPIAVGGLTEALVSGWNDIHIAASDDFDPSHAYYVIVMAYAGTKSTELKPSRIEVMAGARTNYLEITYTRLPLPLVSPETVCELMPYLVPCVVAWARVLAYLKKTNMPHADPGLMSEYNMLIQKNLQFLNKRGESGNENMFRNTTNTLEGGSRARVVGGMVVPSGWSLT